MHKQPSPHPCLPDRPVGPPFRIPGTDAVVIVVVVGLVALLQALGAAQYQVIESLAAAGLVAVAVLKAWQTTPLRTVRRFLHAFAATA